MAARLTELGHPLAEPVPLGERSEPDDVVPLSRGLDGQPPWWPDSQAAPLGHVLTAAHRTGRPPADVAARLEKLGHPAPDGALPAATVEGDDVLLLSCDLDGKQPWLPVEEPLDVAHILNAAHRTGRSPAQVVARLAEFGHRLPEGVELPDTVERDDVTLLSIDLDRYNPWLTAQDTLELGHVLHAALATGRTPADLAARLGRFGHHLPGNTPLPDDVERYDARLLRLADARTKAWLEAAEPVPLTHVLSVASVTERSAREIAARLAALGYALPTDVVFEAPEPAADDSYGSDLRRWRVERGVDG